MKEKRRKGEREGDAVSQLQFLDQPVVTMGLSRSVSKKKRKFQSKNRIVLHSRVFNAPSSPLQNFVTTATVSFPAQAGTKLY